MNFSWMVQLYIWFLKFDMHPRHLVESLTLWAAYRVEQDVRGLKVAVDHMGVGVVEKGKALGCTDCDLHPRHPWETATDT